MRNIISQLIDTFHERESFKVSPREIKLQNLTGKATTVIGMRRVGKTYLCYQQILKLRAEKVPSNTILYINFEDDRLINFSIEDFQLLLDIYYSKYPQNIQKTCHFFFDEIQNIPGWERFIRRVLDTENANIYLTGSSAKLLSTEIATSLRGRSLTTELFPLSFCEYLKYNSIFKTIPKSFGSSTAATLRHAFNSYLHEGGFPETQGLATEIRIEVLQGYLDSVILRDIIERHGVSNTLALKHLVHNLLNTPGGQFSTNKFYNTLKSMGIKCTKNSLYNYLDHLCDSYLVYKVPLRSCSERVRAVNPAKYYPIDTGLVQASTLQHSSNFGPLLENIVYLQLRRKTSNIEYYQHKKGYEVDFVTTDLTSGAVQLIQVSWDIDSNQTKERELRGLSEAMKELKINSGLLITADNEEEIITESGLVNVLPIWKWLLNNKY